MKRAVQPWSQKLVADGNERESREVRLWKIWTSHAGGSRSRINLAVCVDFNGEDSGLCLLFVIVGSRRLGGMTRGVPLSTMTGDVFGLAMGGEEASGRCLVL